LIWKRDSKISIWRTYYRFNIKVFFPSCIVQQRLIQGSQNLEVFPLFSRPFPIRKKIQSWGGAPPPEFALAVQCTGRKIYSKQSRIRYSFSFFLMDYYLDNEHIQCNAIKYNFTVKSRLSFWDNFLFFFIVMGVVDLKKVSLLLYSRQLSALNMHLNGIKRY